MLVSMTIWKAISLRTRRSRRRMRLIRKKRRRSETKREKARLNHSKDDGRRQINSFSPPHIASEKND